MSTLPPADSFADVLAWDDAPATGLTDADLRAIRDLVGERAWRAAVTGLTDEEYRAYLVAFFHVDYPDEDDDAPPDEVH
jgi:hypothetical protein